VVPFLTAVLAKTLEPTLREGGRRYLRVVPVQCLPPIAILFHRPSLRTFHCKVGYVRWQKHCFLYRHLIKRYLTVIYQRLMFTNYIYSSIIYKANAISKMPLKFY
jgi:hypothetical protein